MTRQPVLPAARAAVFTAVCVGVGLAAHLGMSHAPVPAWAILTALGLVFAAARAVAGRERPLPVILALMGAGQLLLHELFGLAQSWAAASADTIASRNAVIVLLPPAPLPGVPSVAGAAAAAAAAGTSGMTGMAGMPGMTDGPETYAAPGGMHMGAGMLLGHALAALVCAWWLRCGEAAVHQISRTAARRVLRAARRKAISVRPPLPRSRRRAPVRPDVPQLRSALIAHALRRRGPPCGCACAAIG